MTASGLRRWFGEVPAAGVRGPWRMFWVGWVLRVGYMTVAHTWRIRLLLDHFQFGWELGRIARSVVLGQGYANAFVGLSGPTAWIPPLYTLLVAAVFRVFGIYSAQSAWVIFAVNSVFSAATALAVYEVGARCFGRRVALWSGWGWALYPAAMQYAVHWVWDMSLTTWLFALVMVCALRMRAVAVDGVVRGDGQRAGRWIGFGGLWGLIALSNPSLLLALPGVGVWMVWGVWRRGEVSAAVRGAVLAGVVMVVLVAPWAWRNWVVFDAWIPTRGNLGAELYESTRESNQGFPWGTTLPLAETAPEMVRYRRLGEVRFNREQGAAGKRWIAGHGREWAGWVAKRVYFFWASVPHPLERKPWVEYAREANFGLLSVTGLLGLGLAVRRRVPAAWMFAGVFAVQPLVYYALTVQARFRHPLEPVICVLTVYLFQSAERGRTWSWMGVAGRG